MKIVELNPKELQEKFPNEGVVIQEKESKVNPDNYFKDMPLDQVRQRYIKFTVHMEALYDVLELERNASIEDLAFRIKDIVYASVREE